MSTPQNTGTTKIDGRTREGRAHREAQTQAEQARSTAQNATESAREKAHEVVEETSSFLGKAVEGVTYGAVRVGQEVNRVRKAAQPHAKTIVYTAVTVTDPLMGIGLIAASEGVSLMRRRARELSSEPVVIEEPGTTPTVVV